MLCLQVDGEDDGENADKDDDEDGENEGVQKREPASNIVGTDDAPEERSEGDLHQKVRWLRVSPNVVFSSSSSIGSTSLEAVVALDTRLGNIESASSLGDCQQWAGRTQCGFLCEPADRASVGAMSTNSSVRSSTIAPQVRTHDQDRDGPLGFYITVMRKPSSQAQGI